jgi:hypothetical protein
MFWTSCDPEIDCYEDDGKRWLRLPSEGPVSQQGHLVTTADGFGADWPVSSYDQIANHYSTSESSSGFAASRQESWTPSGEGGSEFGQGITGAKVPVLDEAWYITMFWTDRPAIGTRMIVTNLVNGKTVVASAGLDTAPMQNSAIAGVAEEVHIYLGTSHRSDLQIGFAINQELPVGPIDCN